MEVLSPSAMTAVSRRIVVYRPHHIRINQSHRILSKSITFLKDEFLLSRRWPTDYLCTAKIQILMNSLLYHHLRMPMPIPMRRGGEPGQIERWLLIPEVELTSTSGDDTWKRLKKILFEIVGATKIYAYSRNLRIFFLTIANSFFFFFFSNIGDILSCYDNVPWWFKYFTTTISIFIKGQVLLCLV